MSEIDFLYKLEERIKVRRETASKDESHVVRMFDRGFNKIVEKIGEESSELIVAALSETKERTVSETADLLFHIMLLLNAKEISLDEVIAELKSRNS